MPLYHISVASLQDYDMTFATVCTSRRPVLFLHTVYRYNDHLGFRHRPASLTHTSTVVHGTSIDYGIGEPHCSYALDYEWYVQGHLSPSSIPILLLRSLVKRYK